MNSCWSICLLLKQRTKPGFFLVELQISLFLSMLLLSLLAGGVTLGWQSWKTISLDAELRDCSRYIFSRIDKDIGTSASSVSLNGSGASQIEVQCLESKHVIRIYCERSRIYRKTLTRSGSGVNPLYINDILVENWNVQPVGNKSVLVSYTLRKNEHSQYFQQLIFCHNGYLKKSEV